jgi:hypothetical protein
VKEYSSYLGWDVILGSCGHCSVFTKDIFVFHMEGQVLKQLSERRLVKKLSPFEFGCKTDDRLEPLAAK